MGAMKYINPKKYKSSSFSKLESEMKDPARPIVNPSELQRAFRSKSGSGWWILVN